MRNITRIVLHTTAGWPNQSIESIKKYWHSPKPKGLGWKNVGYSILIDIEGVLWYVTKDGSYSKDKSKWYPNMITNGVSGYNSDSIHISYIGGLLRIDKKSGKNVYVYGDTRTKEQVDGFYKAINDTLLFLKEYQDIDDITILGHRDLSPDKNGDGIIQENEWIKVCPTFDAIPEYGWIMGEKAMERISKGRKFY